MSLRWLSLGLSVLVSSLAFAGCAISPVEHESGGEAKVSVAAGAIKGGYADSGDHGVVAIVMIEGQYIGECSGSLIAPNLVLTARHCVAEITNLVNGGVDCKASKFAAKGAPSSFFVSTDQFNSYNPSTWSQHWNTVKEVIVPTESNLVCGNDMALLILTNNIDPAKAVPLVPRVDTKIAKDDQYSAIGFGGTVDDGTGSGQRRRLDDLFVNCVGVQCFAQYVSITHEWEGDHGICQGDSGGPAIDLQNRVIGVTSRGGAGCTSPVYGAVQAWGDWIKQNAQHAADLGGYPLPPWAAGMNTDPTYSYPVGDACTDPSSCPSALCLTDANGGYCTRLCNDAGPCPDGYTCATVGDQQFCQKPPPATNQGGAGGTGGTTTTTTTTTDVNAPGPKTEPKESSGCNVGPDDPTKPVPWSTSVAVAAAGLAMLRRRRNKTNVGR